MAFVPAETVKLKTALQPDEIIALLNPQLDQQKPGCLGMWLPGTMLPFRGNIDGHKFKMSRVINRRNYFLPQISGTITPKATGSNIKVKMHLHWAAYIYLLFGAGLLAVASFANPFFALGIPVLYLFATISFKSEAKRAKAFMQDLWKAEIETL